MRPRFWRWIRLLLRGRYKTSARRSAVRLRAAERRSEPGGEALVEALLRLREVIERGQVGQLALAWFRVDEAKASAVWYDVALPPAHAAVLPEELALAEKLWARLTGSEPTPAALLRPTDEALALVRYRLLVARLPAWTARGGRRAAEGLRLAYELMERSPDVLSPYGRWLLAREICRVARDDEEAARQTERFRAVTADVRAADGTSMAFVSGGEFELPLPVSVAAVLDWPGMPTDLAGLKKDAPPELKRFVLNLTPRGEQIFRRAFRARQDAYRHGYPWRKPLGAASEGFLLVRTRVHVPAFFVDRWPVTNAMFAEFAHRQRQWLPGRVPRYTVDRDTYLPTWNGDRPAPGTGSEPVTGVTYQACRAYCHAVGKSMPSEAQWLLALVGTELPETRYVGGEARPSMSDEERAVFGRRAAERGLHLLLPERLFCCDGPYLFLPRDGGRVLWDRRGPGIGGAHLWRTPTLRGRLPDRAGDANLTFRGAIAASRLWARPFDGADS